MPTEMTLPLRDIHLPDGISAWPPAIGWWGVAGLSILLLLLVLWFYRRHQARRLQREALLALDSIQTQYKQTADEQALIQSLSTWLRRVCISHYPVSDVAGLTGDDWLRFLDKPLAATPSPQAFSEGVGKSLLSAPYQQLAKQDGEALLALCRNWVLCLPTLSKSGRGHDRV